MCMQLAYLLCAVVWSDVWQHILNAYLKCETTHSPMSSAQFKNAWHAVPCHCGNGTSLVSDCDVFFLIIFVVNFYINGSVRGLNLESFWTLKLHFNVYYVKVFFWRKVIILYSSCYVDENTNVIRYRRKVFLRCDRKRKLYQIL